MEAYLEYVVSTEEGKTFGEVVLQPFLGYAVLAQAILEAPQDLWRLSARRVEVLDLSIEEGGLKEVRGLSPLGPFSLEAPSVDGEPDL